ncbi:hypothetical protein MG293_020858 [Ovis ammon polii]|uniref:Uncharacterized protein n=1 Tax=Ovis ammon polii TaxID=230172 RepID=A0AAD4TMH0_OVIAM|nr:hypothetical protein MG293_020858 [Ovis ammon polii]
MECRALAWSWCQSASAQLSVSPVALQAVEAAAAELALESPLGHLDHVIQPHGQCLLIAGARASPVHAEEVQGRGAGGLKPAQAPVKVLLDLCLKEDTLKQTLSYLLKKAKQEEPGAPELPEAQHLHHAHAEHQEDPEGVAAGLSRGLGDLEVIKCLEKLLLSLLAKIKSSGQQQPVLVMLCMAGTLQPPVATPGEDATLFRVEAGEDSEAQVDGVVAGIRRGFQLLAEDITEDVEVVPDE